MSPSLARSRYRYFNFNSAELIVWFFPHADDPWVAAHKFLETNDISPMFLDQVANFIIKNTEGVTIGRTQNNVSDPFTGEGL